MLIGAGVLLCGAALLHYVRGVTAQTQGLRVFEERRARAVRPPGENPGITTVASPVSTAANASPTPDATNRVGEPIARIRIPSARMDYVVFEGTDSETLEKGPGHVPGTEQPGGDSGSKNCVITGHRDSHFRHLGWLRKGHRIELDTADGKKTYAVVSREIVAPDAVRVLQPTPTQRLTLITCYPFDYIGPAPKRLVVVAEPVP